MDPKQLALMQAMATAMAQRRQSPEAVGGVPVNAPLQMAPPDLDWTRQLGVPYQGGAAPANAPLDPQRLQQLMRQLRGGVNLPPEATMGVPVNAPMRP